MNIPKDDLFFDLLRSGLWDKAGTVADYSSVDWKALIRLAREQTVVGLISDGVSAQKRYGAQLSMPFEDARQLMVQTIGVERANARLDAVVAELAGIFKDNGISYCLIKGQGTAQNYLHPGHRSPGDIDYLLDDENYRRASEVLAPMAEKAAAYGRHVQTIVTEATADLTKTFEGKAAEGQKAFADAMENMTKNAPAGTETAVAAIKTAMSETTGSSDALVIAGKGADAFQIVNGKRTDYAGDIEVAKKYL